MSEEDKQKHKEYMKESTKKRSINVLKKSKEINALKRVEVDAVTDFIKDEIGHLFDAEVFTDDNDYKSEEDGVNGFR